MARKHPTEEMVKDLAKVFAKHNWSGRPIGLSAKHPDMAEAAESDDDGPCPASTSPQWVTYKLPSGETVTKRMCV